MGLDETEQFWRSEGAARVLAWPHAKQITHTQIYVLDQDEALDFYVGKLGLEVNTDADLGFMRWLTVNVPGQPDRQILLEKPGPPLARRGDGRAGARARDQGRDGRRRHHRRRRHPRDLRGAPAPRASSSPRSRPSASTGPTAACATRSATTSGSARRRRARSRCPTRPSSPLGRRPDPRPCRDESPAAAGLFVVAVNAAVRRRGDPVRQSPAAAGPPRAELRRRAGRGAAGRRGEPVTAHTPSSRRSRFSLHPRPASGEDHRQRKARSGEHAPSPPSASIWSRWTTCASAGMLARRICAPRSVAVSGAMRATEQAPRDARHRGSAQELGQVVNERREGAGASESATPPPESTMGHPPARSRPVSRPAAECDPAARGRFRRRTGQEVPVGGSRASAQTPSPEPDAWVIDADVSGPKPRGDAREQGSRVAGDRRVHRR